jgi:hypothetical protein
MPRNLPFLHGAASSSAGSRALLSAATTAAKRQRVMNVALSALVEAGGVLQLAAAGVMAAVPGPVGQALARQVVSKPASCAEAASSLGLQLAGIAEKMLSRAAALLDPSLTRLAAYRAANMASGQDSRLDGLEGCFSTGFRTASGRVVVFPYVQTLETSCNPAEVEHILGELRTALQTWQEECEVKRAAKLADKMGAAAVTNQLCQKVGSLRLEGNADGPCSSSSSSSPQQAEGGQAISTAAGAVSSSATPHNPWASEELPDMLQILCDAGYLQPEQVQAAGPLSRYQGPASAADLRVAATAVCMACKVAGAIAQLPQLLEQVQVAAARQPWGQETAVRALSVQLPKLQNACGKVASWGLLLAPVLGLLMPPDKALQLQQVVEGVSRDDKGSPMWAPDTVRRVLGLLGHVAAPSAPGCSYHACCNLEGRTETELAAQVCSKCFGARYCCREHQVAHWKAGHKEVCQAAQAAAKQVCDVAAGKADQGPGSS